MDDQDLSISRTMKNDLHKNRMAVLPGTSASRNKGPYVPKKKLTLGPIVENGYDLEDSVWHGIGDEIRVLPPDAVEPVQIKRQHSNSFSAFLSSGAEFVRSWSQYSIPVLERASSLLSLPEVQANDRRSTAILFSVNLQSMVLGTSVLSFPFAFYEGGIYAIALTVIIGLLTGYTGSVLTECLYQSSSAIPGIRKRVHNTFVDICVVVWPKYGRYIMEGIVYFSILRNTVVLVLLTDLLEEILNGALPNIDRNIWTCVWAFAALPFLFISRVSVLAYVSSIGLILYLLAITTILISVALLEDTWELNYVNLDFDSKGTGLATGIILNSFSQHLAFPALEGSMQNPANYKIALQISFLFNILIKIGFGLIGVLNFGPKTAQTITGNLTNKIFISVPIRIAIMFFTYFTIPMQSFVTFDLIDRRFLPFFSFLRKSDGTGNLFWIFLTRSVVMTTCLLFAVLVPHFGVILGLIGSVRGALISLITPALFHYILFRQTTSLTKKVVNIVAVCFGCIFSALGLYGALRELFKI